MSEKFEIRKQNLFKGHGFFSKILIPIKSVKIKYRTITGRFVVDSALQFPTKSIYGVWSSQRPRAGDRINLNFRSFPIAI